MNLIRNIYSWFNTIYGYELYDYLKGNDCDGFFMGPNHFLTIATLMMGVSLFLFFIYYYVIDHPRLNRWYYWLVVLILNGIVNLMIGFGYIYNKLHDGFIPACFTHHQIETTQDGSIYGVSGTEILTNTTCWQFGLANAIIAILFFIILSFGFKWRSRNSKYSPV